MPTIVEVIKEIKQIKGSADFANFPHKKIGILSTFIIQPLEMCLEREMLSLGIRPEFYIGDYNVIYQAMLDYKSKLYEFNPDILKIKRHMRY